MSRGGGRGGGRGRGGFGGRGGGGGGAQDMMRDTLEDLGMTAQGLLQEGSAISAYPGKTPPVLFPPIEIHAPVAISEHDFYLIQKMRETTHRFFEYIKYSKKILKENVL